MADDTLPLFADSDKFYVYVYRDPRPKKKLCPIYVGKGFGKRADDHARGRSHNQFLAAVIQKIIASGLKPVVEIVGWFSEEAEAFALERHLIAQFGRRCTEEGTLCNLTEGGEGASGLRWSEESRAAQGILTKERMAVPAARQQISEKLKGRQLSAEAEANFLAAMASRKGTPTGPHKDETKQKIREKAIGRIPSEETKQKMSISRIGQKRSGATRLKMSEAAKLVQGPRRRLECSTDPAKYQRMVDMARNAAADPQVRAKRSENSKNLWKDPEYRARMLAAREAARIAKEAILNHE